jgi:VWFA-related protein
VKLPEGVYTNIPQYSNENALNVVLLDALNTNTSDQTYVREEMIKYLRKMPESRPVAVYLLGSKLRLIQDFTTDPSLLQNVVRKLKGSFSPALENPTGGPDPAVLTDLPRQNPDSPLVQLVMQFEQERLSFQTDLRVHFTLAAFKAIAHSLAGYPGRKNLVWISAAFPLSIDPNVQIPRDIFAGTRSYVGEIASTADALMDAQVAMYPIDARGLVPYSIFDTATRGYDKFGVGHLDSPDPSRLTGGTLNAESAALEEIHVGMKEMAERTGGKAFYNRNDIDGAMRRSIEDGSTYYTLAYYPENKTWNGKFRKIQIRSQRPGIQLRYRLGYYAVDPKSFAEQSPKEQARAFGDALNPDSPLSTGLPFEAGVVPPSARTANKVLINFAVDAHAISFESTADGLQQASVECVAQAYSAEGKLIKTQASASNDALRMETFKSVMQQNRLRCQVLMDLPAGRYRLRLGVRDNRTGLLGTANAHLTVAPAAP